MKEAEPSKQDYDQPVAYDAEGQPLYAHPPKHAKTPPQVVHMSRPVEPQKVEVSPEARSRHERSRHLYPNLNLSASEYVISAVRRHSIGLVIPIAIGVIMIALALSLLINYAAFAEYFMIQGAAADPAAAVMPILLFCVLVGLGMVAIYYVYVNNRFYLTNESVIQEIQVSLFSKHEQTVSLSSIEDASFVQSGIFQYIFNYGSIRLSTEGDETTYRFTYVANPKVHIATLNNAVEAFKNGRPTDPRDV
ncbi:MAG: PH domain-containing protein [Candidatus Microsaccharimonas sp.]